MATQSDWTKVFKRKVIALLKEQGIKAPEVSKTEINKAAGFILEEACELWQQAYKDGVNKTKSDLMSKGVDHGAVNDIICDEKAFKIPFVVFFGVEPGFKPGHYFFDVVSYDCPKKDDYYLSGHMSEAYKARQDIDTKHLIVKPTEAAKRVNVWRKYTVSNKLLQEE